jgi:hypothetical protein
VDAYEIQDVFLIRSECWVSRDFNQTEPFAVFTYGHQSGIEKEVLRQERKPTDGSEPFHVLRYLVRAEVRLLKPGVQPGETGPTDDDCLALMRFTVAADYRCPKESLEDKDAIGAFSRNAHFHAWPYLREEVQNACSRLRIPRITLPVLRPGK